MAQELEQLWSEIEDRMGVCPSFFKLATPDPLIAKSLFHLAKIAYLDSPLPSEFKEKLFTYLSQFCPVRYCIARHAAFLLGRGYIAGDADEPALSPDEVAAILSLPFPTAEELPAILSSLNAHPPVTALPGFDTPLGGSIRAACTVIFLDQRHCEPWSAALRRLLGPQQYEQLMLFIGFVRMAHFWTEVHSELALEDDVEDLIAEHEALARALRQNAQGEPSRVVGALEIELEELRRSALLGNALRQSEERLRAAAVAANFGIYDLDLVSGESYWSEEAQSILGLTDDGLSHLSASRAPKLVYFKDRARVMAEFRASIDPSGDGHLRSEHRISSGEGTLRWVMVEGRTRFVGEGSERRALRASGTIVDITQRKALENDLRRIAADLSDLNRRKDEFLALLSHEIRNPLAPIRTGIDLLGITKDEVVRERVRLEMSRQSVQLVRLVDDLLEISRVTQGKLELRKSRSKVSAIVESAIAACREMIDEKNHNLIVEMPDACVIVDADPHRLTQMISNLLSNAVRYTRPGGQIDLSVQCLDDELVVSVKDSGVGIPLEAQASIFEMFGQLQHQASDITQGLGIGLSLVRVLARLHGGDIQVQSDGIDRGSAFTLRLPVLTDSRADPEQAPQGQEASTRRRVLVADDNRAVTELLELMLQSMGHEVRVAFDGEEAFAIAQDFVPELLLLDLGMPRLRGDEAARRIREEPWGKSMKLIALTGWGQESDRQRTREAGFDGHFVKPIGIEQVRQLIADLDAPSTQEG